MHEAACCHIPYLRRLVLPPQIVPVSVRGLVLPVLVALRDIAPGEQLLRGYGADWWRGIAEVWEVAEEEEGLVGEELFWGNGGCGGQPDTVALPHPQPPADVDVSRSQPPPTPPPPASTLPAPEQKLQPPPQPPRPELQQLLQADAPDSETTKGVGERAFESEDGREPSPAAVVSSHTCLDLSPALPPQPPPPLQPTPLVLPAHCRQQPAGFRPVGQPAMSMDGGGAACNTAHPTHQPLTWRQLVAAPPPLQPQQKQLKPQQDPSSATSQGPAQEPSHVLLKAMDGPGLIRRLPALEASLPTQAGSGRARDTDGMGARGALPPLNAPSATVARSALPAARPREQLQLQRSRHPLGSRSRSPSDKGGAAAAADGRLDGRGGRMSRSRSRSRSRSPLRRKRRCHSRSRSGSRERGGSRYDGVERGRPMGGGRSAVEGRPGRHRSPSRSRRRLRSRSADRDGGGGSDGRQEAGMRGRGVVRGRGRSASRGGSREGTRSGGGGMPPCMPTASHTALHGSLWPNRSGGPTGPRGPRWKAVRGDPLQQQVGAAAEPRCAPAAAGRETGVMQEQVDPQRRHSRWELPLHEQRPQEQQQHWGQEQQYQWQEGRVGDVADRRCGATADAEVVGAQRSHAAGGAAGSGLLADTAAAAAAAGGMEIKREQEDACAVGVSATPRAAEAATCAARARAAARAMALEFVTAAKGAAAAAAAEARGTTASGRSQLHPTQTASAGADDGKPGLAARLDAGFQQRGAERGPHLPLSHHDLHEQEQGHPGPCGGADSRDVACRQQQQRRSGDDGGQLHSGAPQDVPLPPQPACKPHQKQSQKGECGEAFEGREVAPVGQKRRQQEEDDDDDETEQVLVWVRQPAKPSGGAASPPLTSKPSADVYAPSGQQEAGTDTSWGCTHGCTRENPLRQGQEHKAMPGTQQGKGQGSGGDTPPPPAPDQDDTGPTSTPLSVLHPSSPAWSRLLPGALPRGPLKGPQMAVAAAAAAHKGRAGGGDGSSGRCPLAHVAATLARAAGLAAEAQRRLEERLQLLVGAGPKEGRPAWM